MSARSRTFQILFIAAGAACGFLLGRAIFHSGTPAGQSEAAGTAMSGLAASDRGTLSESDAAAIGSVFSAWQERNSLQRGWEMQRAIDRLDADQVAILVKQVEARVDYETEPLLMALVKRWVRVAPEAAAVWVRPIMERIYAGANNSTDLGIARAWCTSDPERAISFVLERPGAEASANMAWAAMSAIMKGDPAAGLERAMKLPEGKVRMSAISGLISQWAKVDPVAALARLDSLQLAEPWRGAALMRLLPELAKKDSAAALMEIAGRMRPTATGRIWPMYRFAIEAAAAADPLAALAMSDRFPESMRSDFTVIALRGWAEREPVEALKWGQAHGMDLDQAPLFPEGGRSQSSVLAQALTTEPETTVAWLRALPPDAERARLLTSALNFMTAETARAVFAELPLENQIFLAGDLGRQAAKLNPNEAIAWSKGIESGPSRSRVISEIVGNARWNSADVLDAAISQYAPGNDREAALRGSAWAMADKPEIAMGFASQISDADIREEAYRRLAARWLFRDAPAAKAWLAETRELSPEVKAMVTRMAEEGMRR